MVTPTRPSECVVHAGVKSQRLDGPFPLKLFFIHLFFNTKNILH